jgi:hypothetical protein
MRSKEWSLKELLEPCEQREGELPTSPSLHFGAVAAAHIMPPTQAGICDTYTPHTTLMADSNLRNNVTFDTIHDKDDLPVPTSKRGGEELHPYLDDLYLTSPLV